MRRLALAAILVLTAGVAHAQQENNLFISPSGEPFVAPLGKPYPVVAWFNQADANHDGQIDLMEFRADAERFFHVLDRNKDGVIDSSEIYIYEHYYVPEILPAGRADAGGLLVRVQFGGQNAGPQGLDTLSVEPNGGEAEEPAPRQRLDTAQGAVQYSLFASPEPILSADRNLDGKVSLKEFMDMADRHFTVLDIKKRGFFTLDDLPQTDAEAAVKAKRR